jgi:hypothetical protein
MKSFIQYLNESKNDVPHGVLIHDNKVFVGVNHGKPIRIQNQSVLDHVRGVGKKHGYFYEGDGGPLDIKQPLFGLETKSDYKTGWDVDRNRKISKTGVRPHNISILISNVKENWKTTKPIAGSQGTSFDGIHRIAHHILGQHGIKVSPSVTEGFLRNASKNTGTDFLKMAKTTHVSKTKSILHHMEKIAWPSDWSTKKRTTGPENLVDRESLERNTHALDHMGPGVYFAGSGHLKQIADILKSRGADFTMHGGTEIR